MPRIPFAESFDIGGYHPTTPAELREAFDVAIGNGMDLIEVPVA